MFQKKWRIGEEIIKKKYKTFPRSEERDHSAEYDKLSKIRARHITIEFQNTKGKEIIKRLREKGDKHTTK